MQAAGQGGDRDQAAGQDDLGPVVAAPNGEQRGALDATATLTTRIRDQRTHIVLTSRLIPVNSVETRLLRAWTNP